MYGRERARYREGRAGRHGRTWVDIATQDRHRPARVVSGAVRPFLGSHMPTAVLDDEDRGRMAMIAGDSGIADHPGWYLTKAGDNGCAAAATARRRLGAATARRAASVRPASR